LKPAILFAVKKGVHKKLPEGPNKGHNQRPIKATGVDWGEKIFTEKE